MSTDSLRQTDPALGDLPPTYLRLGASLYMPATRADLPSLLNGHKFPALRSLVVCTEDSVHERDLARALANLRTALSHLEPTGPLRFLRPRNPEILAEMVRMRGIERVDGVCLPKLDEHNLGDYLDALAPAGHLTIMPIVETEVAFCRDRLRRLRVRLDQVRERVTCVRIGGNDLLHLLGIRRPKELTAYDTPLRRVIDDLIIEFRGQGYDLSAPVFEHLDCPQVLARELELDLIHGLMAKTAIHPTQVGPIEAAYAVPPSEAALARAVLAPDAVGVFRLNGQMAEPTTHSHWATRTLARLDAYGLRSDRAEA
ncbi:HpcH/HpaI aldolase/citrate lyase family protein [uncultured Thiodictyon sp.]|uniref:HpcH/HpaI aldolase/citrate lyase family protein n=1 Tax=uncultured Thiodictyon sp. TaxID=1846217 RepID=UPI0025F2B60B|nr:HpcH/HpaI aldolase/citrate lyase family protein [uncultured Thiodictyon sp.]